MVEVSASFINSFVRLPFFFDSIQGVCCDQYVVNAALVGDDTFFNLAISGFSPWDLGWFQLCCFGESLMHTVGGVAHVGGAIGLVQDSVPVSCQYYVFPFFCARAHGLSAVPYLHVITAQA